MLLFYTPEISGDKLILSKEESKHCIRVLRMGTGDRINITDGKGYLYETQISEPDYKKCTVEVIGKKLITPSIPAIHLAVAPTKNINRFEWFLEKATEIGIKEITPVLCENSERKDIKPERLEKVLIAAMKQSLKSYLPQLNPLTDFKRFINLDMNGNKLIGYCNPSHPKSLKEVYTDGDDAIVLIGPEGDFSKAEIIAAESKGYQTVTLGPERLRTETAATVACTLINFMNWK